MKIEHITEVGVCVKDLEKASRLFVDLLNAKPGDVKDVPQFQMRYQMLRVGNVDFELMEPTGDGGVIADFIKKRGEGFHHIAFAVKDIVDGIETLKKKGVRFVTDEPMEMHGEMIDKNGNKVSGVGKFTFSTPKSLLGILFEFIEYPEGFEFS